MDPGLGSALGGLGSFAGGVGGGLVSGIMAKREGRRNRRFQEEMSNTAYQRAAKDLEKAGLNRILALGKPASTPPGAMARIPDYASIATNAVNSAIAVGQGVASIRKTEAEAEGIEEENERRKVQNTPYELLNDVIEKWEPIIRKRFGVSSAKEAPDRSDYRLSPTPEGNSAKHYGNSARGEELIRVLEKYGFTIDDYHAWTKESRDQFEDMPEGAETFRPIYR